MLPTDTAPSAVADRTGGELRLEQSLAAYDGSAEDYARRSASLPMTPEVDRFTGALAPGSLVLDAGCGTGRDLAALRAAGMTPIGVDRSRALLAHAGGAGVPLHCADLRALPFADGCFDGVWACASLVHLDPEQTRGALAELARVCRGGGELYASVKIGDDSGAWADSASGRRWFYYWRTESFARAVQQAGFAVQQAVVAPNPAFIDLFGRRPFVAGLT